MNTVIENITPVKAREYFNTSIGEGKKHRPVSNTYVRSYADTMKRGQWKLNGVPIIFDCNGNLMDGCHRMLAVEMAGIPVQFEVRRGVSPDAFTTYDCGRHRTVGQLLAMQGIKNYNLVGSIVIANERLIKYGRLSENNARRSGSRKVTNDEFYERYRRDPNGFDSAASFIVRLTSRCRILSASWAGGMYYYLTHTGGYREEEVIPFFEALFSFDTSKIVSANLLRKRITQASFGGQKMKAEMLFAIIAKAWNAYITNAPIEKLAYYQNKENEYPSLKLKSQV